MIMVFAWKLDNASKYVRYFYEQVIRFVCDWEGFVWDLEEFVRGSEVVCVRLGGFCKNYV